MTYGDILRDDLKGVGYLKKR